MTCSCRTAALQIFVRSLAQVHAPATQHVRSAWLATRPRLISRNISVSATYRRAYTTAGTPEVSAGETREQPACLEDQHKPQPERDQPSSSLRSQKAEPSAEDDRLFSIKPRSKNAIRKAARYSGQSPGGQEQATESSEHVKESSGQETESSAQVHKTKDGADEQTEPAKKDRRGEKGKKLLGRAQKRAEGERAERRASKAKNSEPRRDERPLWLKQKEALKQKFPEGWRPPKRLSPDALEGIRVLNQQFPDLYTTEALAEKFEVSPEAIRRILRAKWEPSADEEEDRQRRWFNRGVSVWQRYAELGRQPPRRWREAGVEASPWKGAIPRQRKHVEEEEAAADKVDPEAAARLQAQAKLSKSLV